MKIAKVLFTVAAIIKIPTQLFPGREQLYIYYGISRRWANHLLITCLMTYLSFLVPCVYPDIIGLLGLLGGITNGNVGYNFPLLLKLVSLVKEKNVGCSFAFHLLLWMTVTTVQGMSIYTSITLAN